MKKQTRNQMKCKLIKGDEVVVIAGGSKGQSGKIDRIDHKSNRVYVGGLNMYKKHVKPDANNPDGGIIDKPMPLHISNVALVDPKTKKPTRIGYKSEDNSKKVRIAKSSGNTL